MSVSSSRADPSPRLDLQDLAIDRAGEIPIGVQLAWALRARISDGRLAPGQRLPGLRELAETLGINANTARSVYQRLEHEGLIQSRQGTGTFVASGAPEPSAVSQIAAHAAREAHRTGVDPREVAAALYVTAEPPTDVDARATERRRELRTQIAALEQALSEIQARHPDLIVAPDWPQSPRHSAPRLLSAEELERVRSQLVIRLATIVPLLEKPSVSRADGSNEDELAADEGTDAQDSTYARPSGSRKSPRTRARARPSTA